MIWYVTISIGKLKQVDLIIDHDFLWPWLHNFFGSTIAQFLIGQVNTFLPD